MKLDELINGIEIVKTVGSLNKEVVNITADSRQVKRDFAFVAYKGVSVDGHDYIPNAIENGATAVISERELLEGEFPPDVTLLQTQDGRAAFALMSSNWYGNPESKLKIIGITGTNGKTSTAHLVHAIFTIAGGKMAIMGSITHRFGGKSVPASTTTPDSLTLHRLFREMVDDGANSVVMEVTSHSLEQKRVAAIKFDAAVFTNLTLDHLDFHKNMQNYLDAKTKLFAQLKSQKSAAIFNADDNNSEYIIKRTKARMLTYGVQKAADLQAKNVSSTIKGLKFTAITPKGEVDIQLKLLGEYNLYNALAAAGVGLAMGLELDVIKQGLESAFVPGRFELVDKGQDFGVVVDYAHTPDALERLLKAARNITDGQLICVFGCGGDRDKGKRPIMGRIATKISDQVIITSDNPRTEEPDNIIAEIEAGVVPNANYEIIADRNAAIAKAIQIAEKNDLVVIAGKGHEDYQIFKDRRIHFDDREVAAEHLAERLRRG